MRALAAEKSVTCEGDGGLGREIAPLADLRALAGLVRLMRAWRPHIVHTHTAKAGLLAGSPRARRRPHRRPHLPRPRAARVLLAGQDRSVRGSHAARRLRRRAGGGVGSGPGRPRRLRIGRPEIRVVRSASTSRTRGALPRGVLRRERGSRTRTPVGWWAGWCRSRTPPRPAGGEPRGAQPRGRALRPRGRRGGAAGPRGAVPRDGARRAGDVSSGWRQDLAAVYGDLDVVVNASRNEGTAGGAHRGAGGGEAGRGDPRGRDADLLGRREAGGSSRRVGRRARPGRSRDLTGRGRAPPRAGRWSTC